MDPLLRYQDKIAVFSVEEAKRAWPSAEFKQYPGQNYMFVITNEHAKTRTIVKIFPGLTLYVKAEVWHETDLIFEAEIYEVTGIEYRERFSIEFYTTSNLIRIRGPLRRLRINDTGFAYSSSG